MFIRVEHIMGLPISLHVRTDPDNPLIAATADMFFARLRHLDAVLSFYKEDSDVLKLARGARIETLDPAVGKLWDICARAEEDTSGAFCAFGLPNEFRPGNVPAHFDPTGVAKGWAIDDAAQLLTGWEYCVNAGGDVLVRGTTPWRIGIESATDPTTLAHVVELTSGAVATSGTYARGRHIFSPRLGDAAPWEGSITVQAPTLTTADVWATALFSAEHPCSNPMVVCDQRYPATTTIHTATR